MTPMMRMPALRQIYRTPEGPWWRRLLGWWRAPVVYEVVENFILHIRLHPKVEPVKLCLPAGFRSDLASTPRISWLFGFRPDHPALCLAGLFHDYYYRHGGYFSRWWPNDANECVHGFRDGGKRFADRVFCRMVAELAHVKTPGYAALAALALFGWPAWKANAKYRELAAHLGQDGPGYNTVTLQGDYTDEDE